MIRKMILLALILLIAFTAAAEKAAVLPDLLKADTIDVDENKLYITAGAEIYIYSLKDFKLIKTFGKDGEGPREFKRFARVNAQPDHLLINSPGKVSFFSRDGVYQREIRVNRMEGSGFRPVAGGYVGTGGAMDGNNRLRTFNFYDTGFKKVNELYRTDAIFQAGKKIKMIEKSVTWAVYDKKFFMVDHRNFVIWVFNLQGEKLYTIQKDMPRQQLTAEHQQRVHDYFKTNPSTKQFYEYIKKQLVFTDDFPVIRTIHVADGKIYVMTFKDVNGKTEYLVMDTDGKQVTSKMVGLSLRGAVEPYPFDIEKGAFYQLVENDDEEQWELHITRLGK